MALSTFQEVFANRYQDILTKALVAMKVANTRFQADLKYGDTVHRFKLDLSNVEIRDVVNLTDQTIDSITDSDQTLVIDQKKGSAFPIAHWEEVQAGPLEPAMIAAKTIALKVQGYIDASVLAEVQNAYANFDTGDLTTGSSNGTPIVLSTTTVPQMITRTAAKLKSNNVPDGEMCYVFDPYALSLIAQHQIGKDIDMAGNVLKNGLSGPLFGWEVYVSNNLTGEAVLSLATTPTDGDTVLINGITFTFKTSLGSTAGNVLIGGSADVARANLTALINDPSTTTANGVALSTANQKALKALRITATNDNTANTMTMVAIGSGRLTLTETLTEATDAWTKNFIHCYAGKKGAIDVVVQDGVQPKVRLEPKQDTANFLINTLYGVKTFDDGAQYMLDLMIDAA